MLATPETLKRVLAWPRRMPLPKVRLPAHQPRWACLKEMALMNEHKHMALWGVDLYFPESMHVDPM